MKNNNPSVTEMIMLRDGLFADLCWQKTVQRCGDMPSAERASDKILALNEKIVGLETAIKAKILARRAWWRKVFVYAAIGAAGLSTGCAAYARFFR